ncbi:MAG: NAD(P)/FAD-dependent oxidoreductase [Gammaproteobacteria bacterium]|nr:NAD(P)/FAD-dependent oxidoreductase [Gammaproteobacteria bacterium]
MDSFDVCIAGAGVVGLGIAYQLSISERYRSKSIAILDSESDFGRVTSSRNSEVIHAGIYYPENSLKAQLCVEGKTLLYEFLEKNTIPYKKTGKLIVAQKGEEQELLEIKMNAERNQVTDLEWVDQEKLRSIEPNLSATAALHSPSTGIIDSHTYMKKLLWYAEDNGAYFAPRTQVDQVEKVGRNFLVTTKLMQNPRKEETYKFLCNEFINSAGLNAQQLARKMIGMDTSNVPALYLCKGDYFSFSGKSPFKHLIYPIPEKNYTGLGIHSTIDMSGQTRFGPDTEYIDQPDYEVDPRKMDAFASSIAKYFPEIDPAQLQPAYSGVRPKISGPGSIAADFSIQGPNTHGVEGLVQLFGMESPALTASLAIAKYVEAMLKP